MGTTNAAPIIHTSAGSLAGEASDGIYAFKGIPYAQPPIGKLRWRPPQTDVAWDGVRDATQFADDCVQIYSPVPRIDSMGSRASGMSEDCLYLNVWTPSDSDGANLPVYVWFHGGGFVRGSAAEPSYDGASLASRGAVVVSVNYRLGAFGFFAHPELTRESDHGASGNYGLMDVIAALEWVRDNISAFGGDPNRVAISGQSAGGAIVGNLLVSPLAKGLFERAIPMSPGTFRPLAELSQAEEYGLMAGPDIDALRRLDADQIMALHANYVPKARGLTTPRILRPIVDGWVMPEQEMDLFMSGRFHAVPLLVGTCTDEGSMLVGNSQMETVSDFTEFLKANFGDQADDAIALYPAQTDNDVLPAYELALGDSQFHYATRSLGRVYSAVLPQTYRYLFTRQTGGQTRPAEHCDDILYVFGTLEKCASQLGINPPTQEETQLSRTMQDAWVRFMSTGNPNGPGLTNWPPYDAQADTVLEFNDDIAIKHQFRGEHMALLDRTYNLFQ